MGQRYILVNITKSQVLKDISGKASEILPYFEGQDLLLLLLNLINCEISLQSICIRFLISNREDFPLQHLPLPKHLKEEILSAEKTAVLSKFGVGQWAGDRLILIGDETERSPYPPNGDWRDHEINSGLNDEAWAADRFTSPWDLGIVILQRKRLFPELLEDKAKYIIVNLDRKEFLDSAAYHSRFGRNSSHNLMTGLLMKLMYSSNKGAGDLVSSIKTGEWAGDRIMICTPQSVCDLDSGYTDVSNASDVDLAKHCNTAYCCIM